MRSRRSGSAGRPTTPTLPGPITPTATTTVGAVLPTWKKALDAPGRRQQMGVLRKIFMARKEWWLLVPDQSSSRPGAGPRASVLHLAARHQDGKWAMIYLADKASFSVNMNKLAAEQGQRLLGGPEIRQCDADRRGIEHGREGVHNARGMGGCDPDLGSCRAPCTHGRRRLRTRISHRRVGGARKLRLYGAFREPVQNSDTRFQGFDSATMGTWCPNPPFPQRFTSRTLQSAGSGP